MNLSPVLTFLWNDIYKEKYNLNMMQKNNQTKLNKFINHKYIDVNAAVSDLTNTIHNMYTLF